MARVSRGFLGRRRRGPDRADRLPPGQYDVGDAFPVLSAGPTPRQDLATWDFRVQGQVEQVARWSWQEFQALPREEVTVDIHCVTSWSKFDTSWSGVSVDTLLEQVETGGGFRHGVQRRRVHHEPAAGRRDRREGLGGRHLRRRSPLCRARRSGSAAGAPPLLLEVREVGAGTDVDRR